MNIALLALAIGKIDADSTGLLSQGNTVRAKKKWCLDETQLHVHFWIWAANLLQRWLIAHCAFRKEAYTLFNLLSFGRRYWRRAEKRGTKGEAPLSSVHVHARCSTHVMDTPSSLPRAGSREAQGCLPGEPTQKSQTFTWEDGACNRGR